MSEDEAQMRHFRGCWCRAELFDLLESKSIDPREMVLLMVVDSLVNSKGGDCYASNEYLGDVLGTSERHIKRMIFHLHEMGLVRRTGFNGRRRTLVTTWSRVPQPIRRRGDPYVLAGGTSTSPQGGPLRPGRGDVEVPPYKSKSKSKSIETSLSPHPSADDENKNSKQHHPRWIKYATILGTAIHSVRKINVHSKLNSWSHAIEKIHTVDGVPVPRIQIVIKWYAAQIQKGDLIRNNSSYLPVAYSGDAFRQKFLRIEDALTRIRSDKDRQRRSEDGPRIRVIRMGDSA